MTGIIDLHSKVSETQIVPADVDGGYLINTGGIVEMVRRGETPKARQVYRLFLAKYRALAGLPLTDLEKEQQAIIAALRGVGVNIIVADEVEA